jgi:hypothetical protein
LLDATEIFRKLNVHKKVEYFNYKAYDDSNGSVGIIYQIGIPFGHVLLLSLQHDRGADPGRVELTRR